MAHHRNDERLTTQHDDKDKQSVLQMPYLVPQEFWAMTRQVLQLVFDRILKFLPKFWRYNIPSFWSPKVEVVDAVEVAIFCVPMITIQAGIKLLEGQPRFSHSYLPC